MIYTFEIGYDGLDNYGIIQFRAYSQFEAVQLFNAWCIEDNCLKVPIPIKSIKVVYNEKDAMEYGLKYGSPRQYLA